MNGKSSSACCGGSSGFSDACVLGVWHPTWSRELISAEVEVSAGSWIASIAASEAGVVLTGFSTTPDCGLLVRFFGIERRRWCLFELVNVVEAGRLARSANRVVFVFCSISSLIPD